jgi:nitroreductase
MNFADLITQRYSVRKFKPDPVEQEKLNLLFTAVRIAPTAANRQPQRVLVIQKEEGLKKIDLATPCRFGAPLVFVVCSDKKIAWKRQFDGVDSSYVDGSIVTTQIMLQAADIGLGSCWVMHFDPAVIIREFGLPPDLIPVAVLPVGHIADDSTPAEFHAQRHRPEELLFFEHF